MSRACARHTAAGQGSTSSPAAEGLVKLVSPRSRAPNQSVARERARPASGGPPANGRVARRGRAPLAAEALRLTESRLSDPGTCGDGRLAPAVLRPGWAVTPAGLRIHHYPSHSFR